MILVTYFLGKVTAVRLVESCDVIFPDNEDLNFGVLEITNVALKGLKEKVIVVPLAVSYHAILLGHEDLKLAVLEITYLVFKELMEKEKLLNQVEQ